ncbi:MAG: ATP-grasp domain-containing protein [Candidatus Magasanikbacteria bacterium]|nr:ATP-grasp domain-containing protein [Candidatus Magasanikbacteria bacterium]
MNILITSAGKRVSLVNAFKNELKAIFTSGKVFAADSNPQLSAACMIAVGWFKVPSLASPNYINELIKICKIHNISLIIPTIDTELFLMAANEKLLKENAINVVISSSKIIDKCRDKRLIHDFFELNGIEVAEEYAKDDLKFPLFIKPSDGSRSIDTFLIENIADLTDYHFQNEKFMFLEYLDQSENDEYTCDAYYGKDDKLKCIVPRKRIEVRDGEVNKGKTEKNELVNYVKENLGEVEGARGCLTIQFFMNKKTRRKVAIEINPRFGGGYPLSYLAGANFPKWIIEEYLLDKKLTYFEDWEDNLLMLRYDNEVIIHNYVK